MISVDVATRLGPRVGAFELTAAFENAAGITALFGPSGSGKTTLINCIAGLHRPLRGRIVLDGDMLTDTAAGIFVPTHKRRIGLVFQDGQLFPHLSVRDNLMFGQRFAPAGARAIELEAVGETLGIAHLLARRPAELSGGEKQRVALGRAVLAAPRLLLLDEPLVALDAERKREILPLIERLRDAHGIPMVYVSHAIEEVARLAAHVVVLSEGRVTAQGPPSAVLGPVRGILEGDRFASASVVTGRIGRYRPDYGLTAIEHASGTILLGGRHGPEGAPARVLIRATDVALATQRPRSLSIRTVLEGTITTIAKADGPVAAVEMALNGEGRLTAAVTRLAIDDLGLGQGDRVFALIKTVALE